MTSKELCCLIHITEANLSILKSRKAKRIRFETGFCEKNQVSQTETGEIYMLPSDGLLLGESGGSARFSADKSKTGRKNIQCFYKGNGRAFSGCDTRQSEFQHRRGLRILSLKKIDRKPYHAYNTVRNCIICVIRFCLIDPL